MQESVLVICTCGSQSEVEQLIHPPGLSCEGVTALMCEYQAVWYLGNVFHSKCSRETDLSLEWLQAASFPQLAPSPAAFCFVCPACWKAFRTNLWLIPILSESGQKGSLEWFPGLLWGLDWVNKEAATWAGQWDNGGRVLIKVHTLSFIDGRAYESRRWFANL